MTKYKEILESVTNRLKENFPKITVTFENLEENFSKPLFFIELDNIKVENFMRTIQKKTQTIKVTFFPENKIQGEFLEMMDNLNKLFIENNKIKINNEIYVEIEEARIKKNEDMLCFVFDICLSEEYREINTAELMEELNLKEEVR